MSIYADLAIPRVVNAVGNLTALGGSIMPPPVLQAMQEAAQQFVDLSAFKSKVGERIAQLTHNQAAHVCCGASAGLVLAAAACLTKGEPWAMDRLPDTSGLKNEVIVHRSQRNRYDFAVKQTGAVLREIGSTLGTEPWELEAAVSERTAAILYFAGVGFRQGALPLPKVIAVANQHSLPVMVDAAAQIPPIENLWRYTEMGADLVIFSGGKALRGPQSTGLILGRPDLVRACTLNDTPNRFIGRPMKVGKEELAGILAAVAWSLAFDWPAFFERLERQVAYMLGQLQGIPGLRAERSFPGLAGSPIPRVRVWVDEAKAGRSVSQVMDSMRAGDISVAVRPADDDGFFLSPQTLDPGEEQIVTSRLRQAMGAPADATCG
jgi:D-glucosaminate-6-phosphate ammonia-lyase